MEHDPHIRNRFYNIGPHPEYPIQNDTYDELDALVKNINDHLGIEDRDRHFANSPGSRRDPSIWLP